MTIRGVQRFLVIVSGQSMSKHPDSHCFSQLIQLKDTCELRHPQPSPMVQLCQSLLYYVSNKPAWLNHIRLIR